MYKSDSDELGYDDRKTAICYLFILTTFRLHLPLPSMHTDTLVKSR